MKPHVSIFVYDLQQNGLYGNKFLDCARTILFEKVGAFVPSLRGWEMCFVRRPVWFKRTVRIVARPTMKYDSVFPSPRRNTYVLRMRRRAAPSRLVCHENKPSRAARSQKNQFHLRPRHLIYSARSLGNRKQRRRRKPGEALGRGGLQSPRRATIVHSSGQGALIKTHCLYSLQEASLALVVLVPQTCIAMPSPSANLLPQGFSPSLSLSFCGNFPVSFPQFSRDPAEIEGRGTRFETIDWRLC